jgi:ABC-type antimicrobial peptide transport system permease subunit
MTTEQMKVLSFIKYFSGAGCIIGAGIFLISLFAGSLNEGFMMSIVGATILVSSMWVFGIGLMFVLIQNLSVKRRDLQ